MPEDSLKILSSKSMFELRLSFNVIVSKAGTVSTSQPMSRRKDLVSSHTRRHICNKAFGKALDIVI